MKQILADNQLPFQRLDQSRWSMPGALYFLKEDFIRQNWSLTGLDESHLPQVLRLGRNMASDPVLKLLAWHLHLFYSADLTFFRFPDHISLLGPDTGIFYILLALSLAPMLTARAARERYPERYALEGLNRIGSTVIMREQAYPGEFGLKGGSLPFLLHYLHSPCYRIGRLDYILGSPIRNQPELFLKGKELTVLCKEGWELDSEGLRSDPGSSFFRETRLLWEDQKVTGTPIDCRTGRALPEERTLNLNEWQRLCPPEAHIANFHIPGGAPFTPENIHASFIEAADFMKKYFSDRPIRAFFSSSWLFSPDWRELLPQSNLTKVQQQNCAFPGPWSPSCGLTFVFGREDSNWHTYPRDNSLRKAMMQLLETRGFLRSGGLFAVPELLNR